jgi:hypothetical protein
MREGGRRTTLGTIRRLSFDKPEVSSPDDSPLEEKPRKARSEPRSEQAREV